MKTTSEYSHTRSPGLITQYDPNLTQAAPFLLGQRLQIRTVAYCAADLQWLPTPPASPLPGDPGGEIRQHPMRPIQVCWWLLALLTPCFQYIRQDGFSGRKPWLKTCLEGRDWTLRCPSHETWVSRSQCAQFSSLEEIQLIQPHWSIPRIEWGKPLLGNSPISKQDSHRQGSHFLGIGSVQ